MTRNRPVKSGWPRNSAPDSPGAHALMLGKQISTQSSCTTFFVFKFRTQSWIRVKGQSGWNKLAHERTWGTPRSPVLDPHGWTPLCQNRSPLVKIHGRRNTELRGQHKVPIVSFCLNLVWEIMKPISAECSTPPPNAHASSRRRDVLAR